MKRHAKAFVAALTLLACLVLGVNLATAMAPVVTINEFAANMTRTTADVEGTVNPEGLSTQWRFQYALSSDLDFSDAVDGPSGSTETAETVSGQFTGLTPGTSYVFRLIAENADGSSEVASPFLFETAEAVKDLRTEAATDVTHDAATLHGSLDPDGLATTYHFEYGTDESYGQALPVPDGDPGSEAGTASLSADITDLANNTTYHYRLVATNSFGTTLGRDETFTTMQAVKGVQTEAATDVTHDVATLHGSLDPDGLATTYHFEYGTDEGYGQTAPVPDADAGSEAGVTPASTDLTGLTPDTTYHYRLVATNSFGSTAGEDQTFTTVGLPEVNTRAAAPRTATSARLNAYVDAQGGPTTYYFEYGPSAGYGSSLPVSQDADAGSERGAIELRSQELTGLTPNTTYHYRVVATNSAGTTTGADRTFTTRTNAEMTLPSRGIELVNAPEKGNQNIRPLSEAADFTQAKPVSADGNKALWKVTSGAPGGTTGGFTYYVATRTANGWHSRDVIPPASEQVGGGNLIYDISDANSDYSRFVFGVSERLSQGESWLVRVNENAPSETLATIPFTQGGILGFVESSSDMSHVLYGGTRKEVYDYGSGTPERLNIVPGALADCGSNTMRFLRSEGLQSSMFLTNNTYHFIATDNESRYYFGAPTGASCSGPEQLYLRHRGTSTTQLISGPPVAGPLAAAYFARASRDGSHVIFSSATQLSVDDANSNSDIYRYAVGGETECLTCQLDHEGLDLRAYFVSEDLSHVYFKGEANLLTGKATPAGLYVWHQGNIDFATKGATRDGATSDGETTDLSGGLTDVKLSEDGHALLFLANVKGITNDNIGKCPNKINPDRRCIQLYRFNSRDDSVECVSCRPDGNTIGEAQWAGEEAWLSADGETVVFGTSAPLLPEDVNGRDDVYEWSHGALQLISDGVTEFPKGAGEPTAYGLSANGSDLFFTVAAPLTGFERDHVANLYDARIGGGFDPPMSPAHCVEDACQGPLAPPPSLGAPGSASFNGLGNVANGSKVKEKHRKIKKKHRKRRRGSSKRKKRAKANRARAKHTIRSHG